ncbi:hypothetical protein [Nitriliruptor alkaliphilus]|uniref:hypothetical protein n=1 Tax=Nitriliruptor alkaliphilus TaxID=427918 RepID=UPI000695AC69|nr:hypothetical protein [Nitriliruptor alkaliphilus]
MAEPLIFINTYRIKDGQFEGFRDATPEWLEFVEANNPRILHFGAYIDEDRAEATTVQVHPDAASLELQTKVVAGRLHEWQKFAEWEGMTVVICGIPTDPLVEQMKQIAGSGVAVTVKTPVGSFTRLPG